MSEGLGQELVVAAVGSIDRIAGTQPDDGSYGAALLPDARVRGPVHQALAREFQHGFLEGPDQVQFGEHRAQKHRVSGFPVFFGGGELDPWRTRFQAAFGWHGPLLHRPDIHCRQM